MIYLSIIDENHSSTKNYYTQNNLFLDTDDVPIIVLWWCFIFIMYKQIFYCYLQGMCSLSLNLNDLYWFRPQVAYFIFYYCGGGTNNSRNDINNEAQINSGEFSSRTKRKIIIGLSCYHKLCFGESLIFVVFFELLFTSNTQSK